MARTKGAGGVPKTIKAQIIAFKNAEISSNKNIARKFGVSESTVDKAEARADEETLELAGKFQTILLEKMQHTAFKALAHADKHIHELGAKDAVITFATLYDKIRLEEGKPTSINQNNSEDHRIMLAMRSIKDLMEIEGYSFDESVAVYFGVVRREFQDIQPIVTERLLSEGKQ